MRVKILRDSRVKKNEWIELLQLFEYKKIQRRTNGIFDMVYWVFGRSELRPQIILF